MCLLICFPDKPNGRAVSRDHLPAGIFGLRNVSHSFEPFALH